MADWRDYLFNKDLIPNLIARGRVITNTQPTKPAGIDIGKMAQDQADKDRPNLKGAGAAPANNSKTCPTCGSPMPAQQSQ